MPIRFAGHGRPGKNRLDPICSLGKAVAMRKSSGGSIAHPMFGPGNMLVTAIADIGRPTKER